MSEWYCVKNFPIPEGEVVTVRGTIYGHCKSTNPQWHYIEITEWQPEDPFNEPKPIGEEDERELTR